MYVQEKNKRFIHAVKYLLINALTIKLVETAIIKFVILK